MFDVDTFMQTEVEGENATRLENIPAGEYQAVIDKVAPAVTPNGSPLLRVTWRLVNVGDPSLESRFVDQTIWLDMTESGALDRSKGKNISLGRLREAVGQNQPGQKWRPEMLIGNVATVQVTHRVDKTNPEIMYDQVKSVAKAA